MGTNTTDSISGKNVVPLSQVPEGAAPPRYRAPRDEDNRYTVTTRVYDEMPDIDDPVISQELPSEGYWAVLLEGDVYRAVPVSSFLVFSDGSFFGADEEGGDVADLEGFVGYVLPDSPGMLRSERVEKLLEETMIREDG